jgi:hypothetical protein
MGFFSGISIWVEKLKLVGIIFNLSRRTPEQLSLLAADMMLKDLEGNKWALLNYATGRAITGWALMEESLVLLASLLLRTTIEKTGLIFFSIINFQVWITTITELFEIDEDFKLFQRRWNKLSERLRAEKDNRDRLAHHYIMSKNVSGNPLGVPIKIASRIDMRSKSRKSSPMTLDQVLEFRTRIDAIADDLHNLIRDMRKHAPGAESASPGKPSERVPDQPI